jgi:hypothetical protein
LGCDMLNARLMHGEVGQHLRSTSIPARAVTVDQARIGEVGIEQGARRR